MITIFKNKSGQGTLEVALAFIIVILLVGGLVNIWFWFNGQMISRQVAYNNTRVAAGTGSDTYSQMVGWNYRAGSLTENMVIPRDTR